MDFNTFQCIPKKTARERLDLPAGKKLLLFGTSGGLANPYKGGEFFLRVLRRFSPKDLEVVIFGGGETVMPEGVTVKVHNLGEIVSPGHLAFVYAAADCLVYPTLADSFSYVVAEALACGTPVVSFAVGGPISLIRHKQNGWLVKPKDEDDLYRGILRILHHPNPEDLSRAASEGIRELCGDSRLMELHRKAWETH